MLCECYNCFTRKREGDRVLKEQTRELRLTEREWMLIAAYRFNPALRPTVDKLLGLPPAASENPPCPGKVIDIKKFFK